MNETSYIIAKLLAICGISRKNKRLMDAGSEAHLLKQAECMLGMDLWREVEDIEELNVEYWTLRKLDQKKTALEESLAEANRKLEENRGKRTESLYEQKDECDTREEEQEVLLADLAVLSEKRDGLLARAHLLRRKIDASRTKIEVIGNESETLVARKEEILLQGYEKDFERLKAAREEVGNKMSKLSDQITAIDDLITKDRNALKDKASREFYNIGKANRDVAELVFELGLIDVEVQGLFQAIGKHLSMNAGSDELCEKICSGHSRETNQMGMLRDSISRQHEIAGMG